MGGSAQSTGSQPDPEPRNSVCVSVCTMVSTVELGKALPPAPPDGLWTMSTSGRDRRVGEGRR